MWEGGGAGEKFPITGEAGMWLGFGVLVTGVNSKSASLESTEGWRGEAEKHTCSHYTQVASCRRIVIVYGHRYKTLYLRDGW